MIDKLSDDFDVAFTRSYLKRVAYASKDEVADFLNAVELEIDYDGVNSINLWDAYLVFIDGRDFADSQKGTS
jgi:hypothetical protein